MEPILKETGKLKGHETLFFEDVLLEKFKGNSVSHASMGPLSLLYFPTFNRFVLHLNDWRYPLMRRIPITADKSSVGSRSYILPSLNGFDYRLTFTNISNSSALSNFDTILTMNSNFSFKGEQSLSRKLEHSPEDKLVRHVPLKESAPHKESSITHAIKQGVTKVKNATKSLTSGSKYLTSTKKKLNLKEIKTKNFKKDAHSSFKKNFFESEEKLSKHFSELRKNNLNLTQVREFSDLRKLSDSSAPSLYLWKEELEEAILNNKDVISQRNFTLSPDVFESKGLMDNLKHGLQGIKESVTGLIGQRETDKSRTAEPSSLEKGEKLIESNAHYQG